MSEDVIIHFETASWPEVGQVLDLLAPQHPEKSTLPHRFGGQWLYPEGLNFITLWRYEDYRTEYEPELMDYLHDLLGHPPSCSLIVNFRRQPGIDVCDLVEDLCLRLLRQLNGVVDDLQYTPDPEYSRQPELWTREEFEQAVVKSDGRFLDVYRL